MCGMPASSEQGSSGVVWGHRAASRCCGVRDLRAGPDRPCPASARWEAGRRSKYACCHEAAEKDKAQRCDCCHSGAAAWPYAYECRRVPRIAELGMISPAQTGWEQCGIGTGSAKGPATAWVITAWAGRGWPPHSSSSWWEWRGCLGLLSGGFGRVGRLVWVVWKGWACRPLVAHGGDHTDQHGVPLQVAVCALRWAQCSAWWVGRRAESSTVNKGRGTHKAVRPPGAWES